MRLGSQSFYAASTLLPRRVRDPAFALYAFCRLSDDAIDDAVAGLEGEAAARAEALAGLRQRLDRLYAGDPFDAPADRALSHVVRVFDMPKALPEALLEGYEWDTAGRRYHSMSEVRAYSARVAGSVGVMMAVLMGERRADMLARASDLGVAMQLTNIARDVGEDARAGRLYLPLDLLAQEGIDTDAFLAAPRYDAAIARVTAALLEEARRLYRRAGPGIAALPVDCRPAIFAARYIYAEIGREIARHSFNSIDHRAHTSKATKLRLLAKSIAVASMRGGEAQGGALAETHYLVEAAARPGPEFPPLPWWNLSDRLLRVVDVIDRLNQRDPGSAFPDPFEMRADGSRGPVDRAG
ncbi:MAG: phytoene/squalene synthase family protein [Pseudomonadota bacterium]